MAFGDLVQTAKATGNEATTAVGVTATFGVTPTVGNLITVHAYSTVASVTFTTDLSSALALTSVAADAGGMLDGFYKIAAASQPTAIKVFPSATSDTSIIICEWAGPFAAAPLDVESAGTSSVSTAVTSQNTGTTPTTNQPSELAIAAIGVGLHLTDITAWSNSFTEANEQQGPATSNRATIAVARRVLTATGTYTTAVTHGSGRSRGMLATFRQSSAPISGTLASTQEAQTMVAVGSTVGGIIGSLAATQQDQTMVASGTVTGIDYPGDLPSAAIIALYDARLLAGSAGAAVSSWPDSGPLAQAALAQGSSTLRPVLNDSGFGGIRAVQFDGVDDRLDVALASTYTEDFAFILVCELLTYPFGTAGVILSTASIPNKHLIGVDDVEDPPGWVVMSSNDGTQAQHHHGTASQTYLEAVPSRFIMTQLVRNDGEHKLWENATQVINLTDSSGENSDLNNLTALKLGCREDNSRHGNSRVAYVMLVDMTQTDEATLLDARDELAVDFAVPGFVSSHTGTLAATQQAQTMVASGEVRKIASGGATATVNVLTDGAGQKIGQGGSTANISVPASGAGTKIAQGGTEADISVIVTDAGTKLSSGGSVANVNVLTDGAGLKIASGGSVANALVLASGGGIKVRNGGSTANVLVLSDGAGTKLITSGGSVANVLVIASGTGTKTVSGGSVANVLVIATGDGTASTIPTGGSVANINVLTDGVGRKIGSGGSEADNNVIASGTGIKIISGGAEADINVLADGVGRKLGTGGSEADNNVLASGDGRKLGSNGSTANVVVLASGGGINPGGGPAGGSTANVHVLVSGSGSKKVSGASEANVLVPASGAGSKLVSGGSTANVLVIASGVGQKINSGGSEADVIVFETGLGFKIGRGGATALILVIATGGTFDFIGGGSVAKVTVGAVSLGFKIGQGGSTAVVLVLAEGGRIVPKTTSDILIQVHPEKRHQLSAPGEVPVEWVVFPATIEFSTTIRHNPPMVKAYVKESVGV